ncbi:hypothetical protein BJX68DRAFT_236075 [Aspergillus pseudodeflectus]|uniref:Uncharacterized protein n=1 Tax=Aspergillus pseudodeflectus TaxID=176178 RepID=A0ABR4KG88_9EURO
MASIMEARRAHQAHFSILLGSGGQLLIEDTSEGCLRSELGVLQMAYFLLGIGMGTVVALPAGKGIQDVNNLYSQVLCLPKRGASEGLPSATRFT